MNWNLPRSQTRQDQMASNVVDGGKVREVSDQDLDPRTVSSKAHVRDAMPSVASPSPEGIYPVRHPPRSAAVLVCLVLSVTHQWARHLLACWWG
jgi:hypothetical protein